jgi:hypothetical protein
VGNVLWLELLLAELGHVRDHFDAEFRILFLLPAAGR